jgi:hypothetical protein
VGVVGVRVGLIHPAEKRRIDRGVFLGELRVLRPLPAVPVPVAARGRDRDDDPL